jgi:hypothetical protein
MSIKTKLSKLIVTTLITSIAFLFAATAWGGRDFSRKQLEVQTVIDFAGLTIADNDDSGLGDKVIQSKLKRVLEKIKKQSKEMGVLAEKFDEEQCAYFFSEILAGMYMAQIDLTLKCIFPSYTEIPLEPNQNKFTKDHNYFTNTQEQFTAQQKANLKEIDSRLKKLIERHKNKEDTSFQLTSKVVDLLLEEESLNNWGYIYSRLLTAIVGYFGHSSTTSKLYSEQFLGHEERILGNIRRIIEAAAKKDFIAVYQLSKVFEGWFFMYDLLENVPSKLPGFRGDYSGSSNSSSSSDSGPAVSSSSLSSLSSSSSSSSTDSKEGMPSSANFSNISDLHMFILNMFNPTTDSSSLSLSTHMASSSSSSSSSSSTVPPDDEEEPGAPQKPTSALSSSSTSSSTDRIAAATVAALLSTQPISSSSSLSSTSSPSVRSNTLAAASATSPVQPAPSTSSSSASSNGGRKKDVIFIPLDDDSISEDIKNAEREAAAAAVLSMQPISSSSSLSSTSSSSAGLDKAAAAKV